MKNTNNETSNYTIFCFLLIFFWRYSPKVGLGLLLIHEDFCGFYITHSDAPQSVGFLLASDQLFADLYLATHNIQNRQTFMPPVGFEPTVSAGERP